VKERVLRQLAPSSFYYCTFLFVYEENFNFSRDPSIQIVSTLLFYFITNGESHALNRDDHDPGTMVVAMRIAIVSVTTATFRGGGAAPRQCQTNSEAESMRTSFCSYNAPFCLIYLDGPRSLIQADFPTFKSLYSTLKQILKLISLL
jgi:hypothetical protein